MVVAFLVLGASVSGCGGPMTPGELSRSIHWKWGKRFRLLNEPRFTLSLAGFLLAGFAIAQTGVDPVALTEYAVIFSIPVLPLTYLPILLVGNDRNVMGAHVNGSIARVLGWFYFGLICLLAVAAPVLFVWTNGGS